MENDGRVYKGRQAGAAHKETERNWRRLRRKKGNKHHLLGAGHSLAFPWVCEQELLTVPLFPKLIVPNTRLTPDSSSLNRSLNQVIDLHSLITDESFRSPFYPTRLTIVASIHRNELS